MTTSTHANCQHDAGICNLGQGTHPAVTQTLKMEATRATEPKFARGARVRHTSGAVGTATRPYSMLTKDGEREYWVSWDLGGEADVYRESELEELPEHRLYTQAEDDAAVVEYLNGETPILRPRLGGTGASRATRDELNEHVAEAIEAGRIIETPGNPYTYAQAPVAAPVAVGA